MALIEKLICNVCQGLSLQLANDSPISVALLFPLRSKCPSVRKSVPILDCMERAAPDGSQGRKKSIALSLKLG